MNTAPARDELSAPRRSKASWLRSPQRVFLRRALFQVHLWTGVALAAYAVVIGLTGGALVFETELNHTMHPALYHLTPGPHRVSLDATMVRIKSAHPGWIAFALRNFEEPAGATDLLMRPASGESTPNYRVVSFNPYTGEILFDRLRYAGVLGFLSNLHVYLLSGETGLLISGWMAVGLFVLCVTGLILWWPGTLRWAAALILKRRSSWLRLNWDLHTVIGFWASAAFIVVIVTGVDFAFPGPSGKIIELLTGAGYRDTGVSLEAISRKMQRGNAPVMTIDQAVAAANRALPQNAPAGYMSLPASPASPFRVTGYYSGAAPYSQLVRILLDPHTGALLASSSTRDQNRGSRMEQYFVAVHFGLFGGDGVSGLLVKIVWVLLGLVPALLAFTGLTMYWTRKLRPLRRRMSLKG
ncbi:MAG: PepSY-associated TM helix domain-containing protein [Terracidiphilus sp.]